MARHTPIEHITYLISLSGLTPVELDRRHFRGSFRAPDCTVKLRTVATGRDQRSSTLAGTFQSCSTRQCTRWHRSMGTKRTVLILASGLDPGLAAVREAAAVPVVGPGESSLFVASVVGRRASIVTVDEHAVAATEAFLKQAPVRPEIVSIRSMDTPVREIVSDLEKGRNALSCEVTAAVRDDGAGTVVLGA